MILSLEIRLEVHPDQFLTILQRVLNVEAIKSSFNFFGFPKGHVVRLEANHTELLIVLIYQRRFLMIFSGEQMKFREN